MCLLLHYLHICIYFKSTLKLYLLQPLISVSTLFWNEFSTLPLSRPTLLNVSHDMNAFISVIIQYQQTNIFRYYMELTHHMYVISNYYYCTLEFQKNRICKIHKGVAWNYLNQSVYVICKITKDVQFQTKF